MIELIDDELCDAIACAGTAEEVRDKVKETGRASPTASRWGGRGTARVRAHGENYQALVETFGGAS